MKLKIDKLQQGGSIDNPVIIDYFKKNPIQLGKFAEQMKSNPQFSFQMITDNKWGPFHEAANKFRILNPIVNNNTRADSLDYINPSNKVITPTNSIEFSSKYKGRINNYIEKGYKPEQALSQTYNDLNAQRLGMSKI